MAVDRYVYRTRNPEMLAAWDAFQAEQSAWHRKAKRLIGRWFPRQGRGCMVQRSSWGGNDRWVGISRPTYKGYRRSNEWPNIADSDLRAAGWRKDKDGTIVPFKKTPEGRAFAKLIDACQPPTSLRNRLIGMPGHLAFGRYGLNTYQCGIERIGDAIYVTWSIQLTDEHDRKLWKSVRLSEYYRLREAEEQAA
jgi:hypothetical protein